MVDMLLIYGECFQNAKQAEQRYAERFPERRHPTHPTFTNIVTNEAAKVAVLAAVAINPHASSREMVREIGISRTSELCIHLRHQFHPFHISLPQALDDNNFQILL